MTVPRRLPTATATGPASVLIRGPATSVKFARALAQQDRHVVGPASATTRSGWPFRSATVSPVGLVP